MDSLDRTVCNDVVRRAHVSFRVGKDDIDCLRRNNVLITQAAPYARKETYWDSPTFSLHNRGFSLKVIDQAERPWVLEEISGLHAEAVNRQSLLPLAAKGYSLHPTPFAELLVEIGVYSIRTLGDFRIELQRTSWQFSEDLIFCHRLDVITRSECRDPRGAHEEIVATMERFGISQIASPVGLSHADNVLHGVSC